MEKITTKKLLFVFLLALIVIIFIFVLLRFLPNNSGPKEEAGADLKCVTSVEEKIIEGNSLAGFAEPGSKAKVYFNYYSCNDPKRGDLVLIDYAGNKNPIVKFIKGVQGDSLAVKESNGGWNILINEEILKNTQGEAYLISQARSRMLSLYIKDYDGKLPEKSFLVLGNLISGSVDSTLFGLIDQSDIMGKVEID